MTAEKANNVLPKKRSCNSYPRFNVTFVSGTNPEGVTLAERLGREDARATVPIIATALGGPAIDGAFDLLENCNPGTSVSFFFDKFGRLVISRMLRDSNEGRYES